MPTARIPIDAAHRAAASDAHPIGAVTGLTDATVTPDMLLQQMRMAKGGVIGTSGKPVVALRFDDGQDAFSTNVYPLLLARGIPASMALIACGPGVQPWFSTTTWDNVRTWNRNGIEMWCHGYDHTQKVGYSGRVLDIVTSKELIEAQDIKCQGWAMPGNTQTDPTEEVFDGLPYASNYTSPTTTWQLLHRTYALTEAYGRGVLRTLPCGRYHGLDHYTVSDGVTLAQAQAYIQEAIDRGLGIELMCHSYWLDTPDHMTLSDFTALLDWIKAKWDDGEIEILTPSGLCFADSSSNHRLDLVRSGGFEGQTSADIAPWINTSGNPAITVETDGGHSGTNYLRIPSTVATTVQQRTYTLQTLGLGGETFLFEGWARTVGATSTTAKVIIQDYGDTSRLNISFFDAVAPAAGWKRLRKAFTLHPDTDTLIVAVQRSSGAGVDWDDISIRKV